MRLEDQKPPLADMPVTSIQDLMLANDKDSQVFAAKRAAKQAKPKTRTPAKQREPTLEKIATHVAENLSDEQKDKLLAWLLEKQTQ
jgi:acyl-CoA reductase-like NAD-dependent aldehyde dehydrogenase